MLHDLRAGTFDDDLTKTEIAGRTEQYWCPIRHAKRVRAPHAHYREFVDYGDAAGYQQQLPLLRAKLKDENPTPEV